MKRLHILFTVVLLASCGGDREPASGSQATGDTTDPGLLSRYAASSPLVDNSDAGAYKVLVMGNSHAAGLYPVLAQLLALGQPDKPVYVQLSSSSGFLDERVNDGISEETLEGEAWTHVIVQGQKYSTTGLYSYPTDAAEYWIRGSKLQGATPIMFPEHPREGNDWEGRTLWDLHLGIAARESACVAPVGLVWDEVTFRAPTLALHQPDGNHASETGLLLTALVFYPVITGQPVESLPELSALGIDAVTEQILRESVSSRLYLYAPCPTGG